MSFGVIVKETRPQFLILTPVCCLVGLGSAAYVLKGAVPWGYLALVLVGALFSHVAVNVLNDYFDYRSGLDLMTHRTPFSGGSGILPAGLMSPKGVLTLGVVSLAVVVAVGAYFLKVWGWRILPLGLLGIAVVVLYTEYITRNPILCLLAPGLGFGPLMVMGTHFALTGQYHLVAFWASLVPGLLVSNLLLINQFPDVEADRAVGRHHLPIVMGRKKASYVYAVLALAAFAWVVVAVAADLLPLGGLLALLPLPMALGTIKGVMEKAEDLEGLVPYLGKNVLYTLFVPALLGVGLLLS